MNARAMAKPAPLLPPVTMTIRSAVAPSRSVPQFQVS
jgi:hypothetical protein